MKKTILSKNYSLLVLVILILYLTYINLPDSVKNNMMGGAIVDMNSPYFGMDDEKLSGELSKHSSIYSFLKNYLWVYIIIVVLLASVTAYYAYNQYKIQGVPMIGAPSSIYWADEGNNFINFFYLMAKTKYGLWANGTVGASDPNSPAIKNFETDFDNFLLYPNALPAIDLYCNLIAPCNMCHCSGPDPNYAGPSSSIPMVPYKGIDTLSKNSCKPDTSAGGKAGQAIVDMHTKRGIADKVFGRIPNCCCNLWQTATNGQVTPANVEKIINTLVIPSSPHDSSLGLNPATGCEPLSAPSVSGIINGAPSSRIPHTDPTTGKNLYIYNMVNSCLGLKDPKNATYIPSSLSTGYTMPTPSAPGTYTVTSLWPSISKCADYNTDLDHGISFPHVLKNKSTYITPSLGNAPKASGLGDVTQNWTEGIWTQTTGAEPKIVISTPQNWPFNTPAYTPGMNNQFWYQSSSGTKYELKIDTHLNEVYAYPVVAIDGVGTPSATNVPIHTVQLTPSAYSAEYSYLESFLTSANIASHTPSGAIAMYNGSYIFPLV